MQPPSIALKGQLGWLRRARIAGRKDGVRRPRRRRPHPRGRPRQALRFGITPGPLSIWLASATLVPTPGYVRPPSPGLWGLWGRRRSESGYFGSMRGFTRPKATSGTRRSTPKAARRLVERVAQGTVLAWARHHWCVEVGTGIGLAQLLVEPSVVTREGQVRSPAELLELR
jgi:hypothetical protein